MNGFDFAEPRIGKDVFIAPNATVYGNITLGDNCSVWFGVVMRAEKNSVEVGEYTNIQDNSIVHADEFRVKVGRYVVIGHGSIVHGCEIGNQCMIGMGSIILNGARIGDNCIIGAGSVVTQNTEIPSNSVALGTPARVVKEITDDQREFIRENAIQYHLKAMKYMEFLSGKR